jgi:hypothetical protein
MLCDVLNGWRCQRYQFSPPRDGAAGHSGEIDSTFPALAYFMYPSSTELTGHPFLFTSLPIYWDLYIFFESAAPRICTDFYRGFQPTEPHTIFLCSRTPF